MTVEFWTPTTAGGVLVRSRRGRTPVPLAAPEDPGPPPPPQIPSRDTLVYGKYEPTPDLTGTLPGAILPDFNNPSDEVVYFTQPGLIENRTIYGIVKPQNETGVLEFRNCLFVGPTVVPSGASAVIDCNGSRKGKTIVRDSTIRPRKIMRNLDGVVGKRYEAYRVNVSNTIDGFGVFTTNTSEPAEVVIKGSLVHDLAYFYPDWKNGTSGATWHSDGTHNDDIQMQGGTGVTIVGNRLTATSILGPGSQPNPQKSWLLANGKKWSNGAALTIQDNTGAGIRPRTFAKKDANGNLIVYTVTIDANYVAGGLSQINIKPGLELTISNNVHDRDTAIGPSHSGYWDRFDDHSTIAHGLNTGTNNNRWHSDPTRGGPYAGQPLTEPRDKGIHYNA